MALSVSGRSTSSVLRVGLLSATALLFSASAHADPVFSSLLNQYLIIGTGNASSGNLFESVKLSNVELGANQEVVSTGGAHDLRSTSEYPGGLSNNGIFTHNPGQIVNPANAGNGQNRWSDIDTGLSSDSTDVLGLADVLPGARTLFEGIDFSGNVAVLGNRGEFALSNGDINANLGFQCNSDPTGCYNPSSADKNIWFPGPLPTTDNGTQLAAGNGVSQFNPSQLTTDIGTAYLGMDALNADLTLTDTGYVNRNYKDSASGPVVFDLDAIDNAGNNDGFAVIDININDKWALNNTDLILKSNEDTFAIFRMQGTGYFDFSNSSVMMGGSGGEITNLGALFLVDQLASTNQVFNLNNVILGGVALWDMNDYNKSGGTKGDYNPYLGDKTQINLQNAQGCGQFVGHEVIMSNNRWNRCEFEAITVSTIPEPATLGLVGMGLVAAAAKRRRRR